MPGYSLDSDPGTGDSAIIVERPNSSAGNAEVTPLNIADELRKLQDLHRSGALTDAEFAAAKTAVLAQGTTSDTASLEQATQAQLQEIQLQNEVARLDREWQLEREQYMVAGRYGQRYIPSQGMSVLGGIAIVGFGIVWTAMASSMGAPGFFPLFGVLFILFGVGVSIYSCTKASEYDQAYRQYRHRRSQLLTQQESRQRAERESN